MSKKDKPGRHQRMLAAYGFGLFSLPRYREIRGEGWQIRHHLSSMSEGYPTPSFVEGNRFVLYQGRRPWMSTGLFEVESHAFHVHAAHGLVVVAGLGMGMYAFAACAKPQVERVVVVERDAAVIAMFSAAAGLETWPDRHKLIIVQADALDAALAERLTEPCQGRAADYFYADIWPLTPDATAPPQAGAMVRALAPKAAGWWGQELNFGQWCLERRRPIDGAALADYAALCGVPIPADAGYAAFCRDVAAVNHALIAPRPPRRRPWWRRFFGAGSENLNSGAAAPPDGPAP